MVILSESEEPSSVLPVKILGGSLRMSEFV
jgi:hypothetical protein